MPTFNICIIRPPGYVFSSIFLELAELIAYSLDDNGFAAQIRENYLDPSGRNLLIGCHLIDASLTDQIPADTIILNTEQIGGVNEEWQQRVLHYLRTFPSWDYSWENIARLKDLGIHTTKFFRIGYHPRLQRIPADKEKDIDVLFYGSMSEPRAAILDGLERRSARVQKLFGVFGQDRDAWIARSKLVLNLHFYKTKTFEVVRVHYLMNNAKAIVSQFDESTKIESGYSDGLMLAPYEEVVDRCFAALGSKTLLKSCEEKSLETIMRIDAAKIMGELLA